MVSDNRLSNLTFWTWFLCLSPVKKLSRVFYFILFFSKIWHKVLCFWWNFGNLTKLIVKRSFFLCSSFENLRIFKVGNLVLRIILKKIIDLKSMTWSGDVIVRGDTLFRFQTYDLSFEFFFYSYKFEILFIGLED